MKIGSIEIKKAYYGIVPLTSSNAFIGTTPVVAGETDDRLRFVANSASSFYLKKKSSNQTVAQYSTDGTTWTDIPTASSDAVSMASGDTVYIRGKLTGDNSSYTSNFSIFKMTGSMQAKGNIMYWYNYEQPEITIISYDAAFMDLFSGCTSLTTAPELPATTLTESCCAYMFYGCTSLTTAPELPATTIAQYCYQGMFYGCTHLTSAPELPATSVSKYCYEDMFKNCTSLTAAPELPAMTVGQYCYHNMFYGCTSLTTAPTILPATTLYSACYYYMFYGCTHLTSAPELPATRLDYNCYDSMFQNCTNLSYIKCLATSRINENSSTNNWVSGVAATGIFVKDPTANWPSGNNGIPSGWTVQDA